MTPEERLRKIEEATLVNVALMDRIERRVDAHDEEIAELRRSHVNLASSMSIMTASMNALFERMDRFIRGLESNGHKQ